MFPSREEVEALVVADNLITAVTRADMNWYDSSFREMFKHELSKYDDDDRERELIEAVLKYLDTPDPDEAAFDADKFIKNRQVAFVKGDKDEG